MTDSDSKLRVKAYRSRLATSSFSRVEAYVTAEEKSKIDAVKTSLGVNSDIAVAGLIRLGLEQFSHRNQLLSNISPDDLNSTETAQSFIAQSASAFSGARIKTNFIATENPIAKFFKKRTEI